MANATAQKKAAPTTATGATATAAPAPAGANPIANAAKNASGYDAQRAAVSPNTGKEIAGIKPSAPPVVAQAPDALTELASALKAAVTPTERDAIYLKAEAAGIPKDMLDGKVAELAKGGGEGGDGTGGTGTAATGESATAGQGGAAAATGADGEGTEKEGTEKEGAEKEGAEQEGAEKEGAEKEKPEALEAGLQEEKTAAEQKAAAEKKGAGGTSQVQRQAAYADARGAGTSLQGGVSQDDDGVATGVTVAGETAAKAPVAGEKGSKQAQGTAFAGASGVGASGNLANTSSQFEGQQTRNEVGAGAAIKGNGTYSGSVGVRSTDSYDSTAVDPAAKPADPAAKPADPAAKPTDPAAKAAPEAKPEAQDAYKSKSTTYAGVGYDSADGVSAAAGRSSSATTVQGKTSSTESTSTDVAYGKGNVTLGQTFGSQTSEQGQWTAEEKKELERKELDAAAAKKKAADDALAKGEALPEEQEAEEQEQTEGPTTGKGNKIATSVSVGADGIAAGASSTNTETLRDGSQTASTKSGGLGLSKEGVTGHAGYATATKNADGTAQEDSIGATANFSEGKYGVQGSSAQKDKESETKLGVSGGVGVDMRADGQLEGMSGNLKVDKGPVNVVVAGEVTFKLEEPKQVDGQWIVTYKTSASGTLGGGAEGKAASVEASVSAAERQTGSRHFKTKDEADAFYKKGPQDVSAPTSAAKASEMAVGDRSSKSSSVGGTVGGSAVVEGVKLGVKFNLGSTHTATVIKTEGSKVQVETVDTSTKGVEGTIGGPGVGIKGGLSSSKSQGIMVEFDLATPDGKANFEAMQHDGKLPPGVQADAETTSTSDSKVGGANLGPIDITNTATVEESVTTTKKGETIEKSTGTDSIGIDAGLLGKHTETASFGSTEVNDKARTYNTQATVDSSDAQATNESLAQATGTHYNANVQGAPKGKWTVASQFNEAQIQTLIGQIKGGHFNADSLIYQSGYGKDLISAVKGGADMDGIRHALSEFVANSGARGLQLIRDTVGGTYNFDLGLAGDPYFTGTTGRLQLEQQLADYKQRLTKRDDPAKLLGDVAATLKFAQERQIAIGDPKRYPELPTELRTKEIAKSQSSIDALTALRDQAIAALSLPPPAADAKATQGATVPAAAKPGAAAKPAAAATAAGNKPASGTAAPAVAPQVSPMQPLTQALAQLKTAQDGAKSMRYKAQKSRWVQVNGAYAFQDSAFAKFGETHWYGDGSMAAQYADADGYYQVGEKAWASAEAGRVEAEAALTDVSLAMSKDPAKGAALVEAKVGKIKATADRYGLAKGGYKICEDKYQAIKKDVLAIDAGNVNAYFLGYNQDMPDGSM